MMKRSAGKNKNHTGVIGVVVFGIGVEAVLGYEPLLLVMPCRALFSGRCRCIGQRFPG